MSGLPLLILCGEQKNCPCVSIKVSYDNVAFQHGKDKSFGKDNKKY